MLHSLSESPSIVSTENGGRICPSGDRIVPRKFGAVAKYLWRGKKPAAEVMLAANAEMLKPVE